MDLTTHRIAFPDLIIPNKILILIRLLSTNPNIITKRAQVVIILGLRTFFKPKIYHLKDRRFPIVFNINFFIELRKAITKVAHVGC